MATQTTDKQKKQQRKRKHEITIVENKAIAEKKTELEICFVLSQFLVSGKNADFRIYNRRPQIRHRTRCDRDSAILTSQIIFINPHVFVRSL